MARLRVGVQGPLFASRPRAEAFGRVSYLSAVANRVDSYWVPDHLNGVFPRSLWQRKYSGAVRLVPSPDAYLEPWTMLGHLAARNRLGRMHLGVSVTDTGRRNPAVTAQAAATLNLLARGRAILGIGPGEREGNEPYGVDWSRPVARFEEGIATIRALWDSRGELVNRDSPYFPLRNAVFDLPPYQGKWPPIWIAGHKPRMLRAVGRYADGFLPAFAQRPQDYADRLQAVRDAASDAGRDPMGIVAAMWLPVITGKSRRDVDDALESELIKIGALNFPHEIYERRGAQHPMGSHFSGVQDLLPHDIDERTALEYIEQIPTPVIRDGTLNGTPEEVLEQAAQWRDSGVRYFILLNVSPLQRSLRKGLASARYFNSIVRGLKRL